MMLKTCFRFSFQPSSLPQYYSVLFICVCLMSVHFCSIVGHRLRLLLTHHETKDVHKDMSKLAQPYTDTKT